MAKYIDADAALNAIKEAELGCEYEAVEAVPTADVRENVKGEWKPHPTEREWDVCSNCGVGVHRREYGYNEDGTEWVEEVSYMFCPWCGAKMEVNDGKIY